MGAGTLNVPRGLTRRTWLALAGAWVGARASTTGARCTLDRGAIVRGPRDRRRLSLVFTGDQFAEGGPTIQAALRRHKAPAAFFLTGRFLRDVAFRPLLDGLLEDGHDLGPHSDQHLLYASWDQPPRLLVTRGQFEADLRANLEALRDVGADTDQFRYFLPPYEHYTEEIARWTSACGRTLINMTPGTRSHTDYMEDDDPKFVPAAEIARSVLDAATREPDGLNGYLLLMHVGAGPRRTRDRPADQLDGLLEALGEAGYRFVRVGELLEGCG